jgi:predicted PurR-regulated permease PerM
VDQSPVTIEQAIKIRRPLRWDIGYKTLFKITFFLLALAVIVQTFKLIILFFLGTLLAGSLFPVVNKLEKKGIPKFVSIGLVAAAIIALVLVMALVLIPSVFTQITDLLQRLPKMQNAVLQHIPSRSPFHPLFENLFKSSEHVDNEKMLTYALYFTNETLRGVGEFLLVLIFCIYILVDQNRAYKWVRDFFKAPVRQKLDQTLDETSDIVIGYVTAQFVTSVLAGVYIYAVMRILHVPAALTLGFLAAIFDVLPVLGFFLALIPAVLLSLVVSPTTGLITFVAYLLYHVFEGYVLVPMIYGNRMKVSSLVVLLALLAAGYLGGVLPAIAILPIVASYPIIERIWLSPYLDRKVLERHSSTDESANERKFTSGLFGGKGKAPQT